MSNLGPYVQSMNDQASDAARFRHLLAIRPHAVKNLVDVLARFGRAEFIKALDESMERTRTSGVKACEGGKAND